MFCNENLQQLVVPAVPNPKGEARLAREAILQCGAYSRHAAPRRRDLRGRTGITHAIKEEAFCGGHPPSLAAPLQSPVL